jgi:chemotaxis protein methyltransferase CheR
MTEDCTGFLQWALPQLQMQWSGFRKVRNQVCKRVRRRMQVLELENYGAYQTFLEKNPAEWLLLDEMCRITISRFYRDRAVFDALKNQYLLILAGKSVREKRSLRCWSVGCASGEEPYTLALIWMFVVQKKFSGPELDLVATDVDKSMLERAKTGCYGAGSLKDLPQGWKDQGFIRLDEKYCIRLPEGIAIHWIQQDIRKEYPAGFFDLILCRNLVATYFDITLQVAIFKRFSEILRPGGLLVLGCHENLPAQLPEYACIDEKLKFYSVEA